MSLDVEDPALAQHLRRLEPYARGLLRAAGEHATRLHADAVAPEHLLSTLMEDPRSAARAAVLHAFADPATISEEALAISPGLMVVASGSTLPFSVRAVEALAGSRSSARAAGEEEVGVARILVESSRLLDEDLRRLLGEAGFASEARGETARAETLGAGLFRHFSTPAKRVLSGSNRLAAGERAPSISHVHLLLACLQEDEALAARVGLSSRRARQLLAGRTRDDTEPARRALPPDPSMLEYLAGLGDGADSIAMLAHFLAGGTPELAQILLRSKISRPLLERARNAFHDPAELQADDPARR